MEGQDGNNGNGREFLGNGEAKLEILLVPDKILRTKRASVNRKLAASSPMPISLDVFCKNLGTSPEVLCKTFAGLVVKGWLELLITHSEEGMTYTFLANRERLYGDHGQATKKD